MNSEGHVLHDAVCGLKSYAEADWNPDILMKL